MGTTMRQRMLGKTGIAVSELGFGSLFASALGPGFAESRQAVRRAVELGINYFDTAPAYANSEEVLGKILAEIDAPLVVSTKLGGRPQPFDPRNAEQLVRSAETSLRLLHRDVIDVMFVHEPDRPLQYDWWTDPESVRGPVLDALAELLPAAKKLGMGVVLGSALQQGALGRRYDETVRAKPMWLSQARQQQLLALYALLDELGMPIV